MTSAGDLLHLSAEKMKSSRVKEKMSSFRKFNLISSSPNDTWRLPSTFFLFLILLVSWTDVEGENVTSFTPSEVLSRGSSGEKAYSCSEPKTQNGKWSTTCRGYTTIPSDIREHEQIQILDMSEGNALQTLTNGELSRANLPMLSILTLKNCQIRTIERGTFQGTNVLTILDLSFNRIGVLDPEVFAGLSHLHTLKLDQNPIYQFQAGSVFPPLSSLKTLDISKCELNSISGSAFDKLTGLEKLHLYQNKLTRLDWRLFRHTRSLNTLDLYANPWHCDCHVTFLIKTLRELQLINTISQTSCDSSPSSGFSVTQRSLGGVKWDSIQDALFCPPNIEKLTYKSFDTHLPPGAKAADSNEVYGGPGDVKFGQDVYFECKYSGYPVPEIMWYKDKKEVHESAARGIAQQHPFNDNDIGGTDNQHDSSLLTPTPPPLKQKPKVEVQPGTFALVRNMDEDEKKMNYDFIEHLIIRRVEASDSGSYECFIRNNAGSDSKVIPLNLTTAEDDFYYGGVGGSGKKTVPVWAWILVAGLCALILVLISFLICLVWRRKQNRKQERFRKVMQDKFKDSNIDLGEFADMKTTPNNPQKSPSSPNRLEGATPLLDNGSEHSTIVIVDKNQTKLPDVALGNAELVRNSQIFSPKPPPALLGDPQALDYNEARKEFFARQISEPYSRPGSAMSLSRPGSLTASQRRYIFANQHFPTAPAPGGVGAYLENQYAVPDHIRTLPRSGSAMSMSAIPDSALRRQMFLRQYSQPQHQQIYGTTTRPYPMRRNPSTSSEPPIDNMMAAFNYSTLPRRPLRLQSWSRPVSPTGSTCSTYSTLSWRPNVHPVTGIISDGIGPRRDAGGGSNLSLSKTPDPITGGGGNVVGINGDGLYSMNRAMGMATPTNGGRVLGVSRNPRLGHNRTPSSLTRGHNDFFSFEPIQEVEGSDVTSSQNLSERQAPAGGLTTQSLQREPRYKKKKPPPIAVFPTNLKEPSRAFDHLKGRSVSPALRNSDSNNIAPAKVNNGNSDPLQGSLLESTIDEVPTPLEEKPAIPPANRLSLKSVPPPPPPKPKRVQTAEENGVKEENTNTDDNIYSEISEEGAPPVVSDGTVV